MLRKKSVLFNVLVALTFLALPAYAVLIHPDSWTENSNVDTVFIDSLTHPDGTEPSVRQDNIPEKVADAVTYCPQCGGKNSPDSNYCTQCGTELKSSKANLYKQARSLLVVGKNDQAIQLLEDHCTENPKDINAKILLAKAYLYKCEQLKENRDKYYRSLVGTPYNIGLHIVATYRRDYNYLAEGLYICGKSYLINNRPLKASRYINKAIKLVPDSDIDYYLVQADSYAQLAVKAQNSNTKSEYRRAKKIYKKIINTTSNDQVKAKAYYRLGNILSYFRENKEAQKAFRSALNFTDDEFFELKIREKLK